MDLPAFTAEFVGQLAWAIERDPKGCTPTAGAAALLVALHESNSHQVGIATGVWQSSAALKLSAAGLSDPGIPLVGSDDFTRREDIMRHCHRLMRGKGEPPIYIGDGVWDLEAAQALGWNFIAIGPRLKGKSRQWFADFTDPALWHRLGLEAGKT